MTLEELKKQLQQIMNMLESSEDLSEEEIKELEEKVDELEAEKKSLLDKAEKRKATLDRIKRGMIGRVVEEIPEQRNINSEDIYATKEYRNAFLKNLLHQEMTPEERAAFTHTTDNSPLPTKMLDEIWDLVSEEHSILNDITTYRTGTIIEIEKHISVKKGRAKKVSEGETNEDTHNEIVSVTLSGIDFSKTVKISYASKKMSLNSFEEYLKTQIANELGEVMSEYVVEQIKTDMSEDNKMFVEDPTNLKYKEVATAFGLLKKAKKKFVYLNNNALYTQLCGMVDDNGRPIFQPSANADAEGYLLGATIRIEEALPNDEILIGASKNVVMNMVEDILLETDKDIESHKHIYSGYARGEASLMYDKSFSLIQLKTGNVNQE